MRLIHIKTNREIKSGESIFDSRQTQYIFNGFSRGRIGPKILVSPIVSDTSSFSREYFPSVFPAYVIIENE